MENTLSNKAKFFAQYWLQYIFTCEKYEGVKYLMPLKQTKAFEKGWLELKPLSSISDEDTIEMCKLDSFDEFASKEQVFEILSADYKNHRKLLSNKFGVSEACIKAVRAGTNYKLWNEEYKKNRLSITG